MDIAEVEKVATDSVKKVKAEGIEEFSELSSGKLREEVSTAGVTNGNARVA